METFAQQVVNGITLGSVYGLVAVAFTLLFGVLGVVNIAHGEVAMVGAFLFLLGLQVGMPLPIVLLAVALASAALSVVIERVCFRPFRRASIMVPLLSTLGMQILLQSLAVQMFGAEVTPFRVLDVVTYEIGAVNISTVHVIIVVTAVVLMLAVSYWVYGTKLGRAMRAIAENADVARAIGINAGPVILLAFAVSGPMAGIAGILVGLNTRILTPFIGLDMLLKAIVVVTVGGMGSLHGAMLAGLIVGFLETFAGGYGSAYYRDGVVYVLLLLMLLLRPEGLLGKIESRRV